MFAVTAALAPVFALILAGYLLRRLEFPAPGFWPQAEKLTYYVLFPALLIDKVAGAQFGGQPVWQMAAGITLAVLAVTGVELLFRSRIHENGPSFTSVFQGSIRPNTYVGLSAAWALLGEKGVVLSSVALMTLIPLVNVLSVTVLSRYGQNGDARSGLPRILRELARNPLILACLAGFGLNAAKLQLGPELGDTLYILGRASLPMGLLAVGAGLTFREMLKGFRPVVVSSALKLVILPVLTILFVLGMGVRGDALTAAAIFTAIPASVSSFILARQLGGDHRLMAAVITAQTLAAAITMPLVLGFSM